MRSGRIDICVEEEDSNPIDAVCDCNSSDDSIGGIVREEVEEEEEEEEEEDTDVEVTP